MEIHFRFLFRFFFAALVVVTFTACSNAIPTVSQLFTFSAAPTKDGASTWTISVGSKTGAVSVYGHCDTHASDLQYSLDNGSTWLSVSTIAGADSNCHDGNFSFALTNPFASVTATQVPMVLRNIFGTGPGDLASVTFQYVPFSSTNVNIVSSAMVNGLSLAHQYSVNEKLGGGVARKTTTAGGYHVSLGLVGGAPR